MTFRRKEQAGILRRNWKNWNKKSQQQNKYHDFKWNCKLSLALMIQLIRASRHNHLRLDVSVGCFLAIFHCIFFLRLLTFQIDEAASQPGEVLYFFPFQSTSLCFVNSHTVHVLFCLGILIFSLKMSIHATFN